MQWHVIRPGANAGDLHGMATRGVLREVVFSLGSTSRRRFPTVKGGGKARSFVELQLLKQQNGAGIPAKHRRGNGNWRMGRGEPRRAGEGK